MITYTHKHTHTHTHTPTHKHAHTHTHTQGATACLASKPCTKDDIVTAYTDCGTKGKKRTRRCVGCEIYIRDTRWHTVAYKTFSDTLYISAHAPTRIAVPRARNTDARVYVQGVRIYIQWHTVDYIKLSDTQCISAHAQTVVP